MKKHYNTRHSQLTFFKFLDVNVHFWGRIKTFQNYSFI